MLAGLPAISLLGLQTPPFPVIKQSERLKKKNGDLVASPKFSSYTKALKSKSSRPLEVRTRLRIRSGRPRAGPSLLRLSPG